jgi:hypothetical protein
MFWKILKETYTFLHKSKFALIFTEACSYWQYSSVCKQFIEIITSCKYEKEYEK